MKPLLTLAATLILTLAGSLHAAESVPAKAEKKAAPAAAPAEPLPFASTVTTLDKSSFTHGNKDGTKVTFVLTSNTVVQQGKEPAKFADVKVGDQVSGLRLKRSATEYELVKITKFGPKPAKK